MQASGNDFVVLDGSVLFKLGGQKLINDWQKSASSWARLLCSRNFAIGADGLIVIFSRGEEIEEIPSFVREYPGYGSAPFAWSFTNDDGSASAMCGNALMCAALWLDEKKLLAAPSFSMSTALGDIPITIVDRTRITIDLGHPKLKTTEVPMNVDQYEFIGQPIDLSMNGKNLSVQSSCVGMGNPHCVIFDSLDGKNTLQSDPSDCRQLKELAELLQKDPLFPEGVNVEFAASDNPNRVRVIVFERGVGRTLACASGAAATVVAGVLENRLSRKVEVQLEGGSLFVDWSHEDGHIRLTGQAQTVFWGNLDTGCLNQIGPLPGLREVCV
jgi:diaminopimelate epimerase